MCKDQLSAPTDFSSLAKFVADVRVSRPQAWRSVERLKLACALEATRVSSLRCDADSLFSTQTVRDPTSEFGQGFDDSDLATRLSAPCVWPPRWPSVDLLDCGALSDLPTAPTTWFRAE